MWIVKLALRRPYTFVVMALLILLLGIASIKKMPRYRPVIELKSVLGSDILRNMTFTPFGTSSSKSRRALEPV